MSDISNAPESLVLSPSTTSLTVTDVDLPTELVVKILEIAAASSAQTAATLCRVAQWVRALVVPHLHTVCEVGIPPDDIDEWNKRRDGELTLQTEIIAKNPELGRCVHALWTRNYWNDFSLIKFMKLCPNVRHIAFADMSLLISAVGREPGDMRCLTSEFLATTHNIHITTLFTSSYIDALNTAQLQFLGRISHLCVLDIHPGSSKNLSTFSGLSHFALPYHEEPAFISSLVAAVAAKKTLECVVVIVDPRLHTTAVVQSATGQMLELHKSHAKFLLLEAEIITQIKDTGLKVRMKKLHEMWESEVRRGESLWDMAKKYTQQCRDLVRQE